MAARKHAGSSQRFFQLAPLDWLDWAKVLAVTAPAYGLSLLSDRLQGFRGPAQTPTAG